MLSPAGFQALRDRDRWSEKWDGGVAMESGCGVVMAAAAAAVVVVVVVVVVMMQRAVADAGPRRMSGRSRSLAGGGDWTGRRMRCRDAVDSVDRRREGEDEGRGIATFANGVQIRSEAQRRRRQTQAKPAANALLDKLLIAGLFAPLTCPVTVALAPAAARRPPGARRDETTTNYHYYYCCCYHSSYLQEGKSSGSTYLAGSMLIHLFVCFVTSTWLSHLL